jgi:hypothetical protein
MEPTQLPTDGFSWKFIFEYFFRNSIEKIKISLKSDKNDGYFTRRPLYIRDNISLNSSYNEKFSDKFVEKIEKQILFSVNIFQKSCRL